MTVNALSAASLVIYVVLLQPTLYILYRHGWPGFLGWFYLQLFCVLRIVGNGLSLNTPLDPTTLAGSSGSSSITIPIVNNIGLSPLLLATAGILHEARRARRAPGGEGGARSNKFEWRLVIQYHLLVSGALGLIVAGVVLLQSGNGENLDTAASLMKVGSAIVLLCWVLLAVWAGVSLMGSRGRDWQAALDYVSGSKLLHAVIIAIPLIALRIIYGVASLLLTATGHPASAFSTSLAVKVVLATVPEMVMTIVFIVVGIATKDVAGAFWKKENSRRGNGGIGKEVSRV